MLARIASGFPAGPTTISGGRGGEPLPLHACKLRQVLGVEPQDYEVGLKAQPVQRVGMAVTDQPGVNLELALLLQALLQFVQRVGQAGSNQYLESRVKSPQPQNPISVGVTPRLSRGNVTAKDGRSDGRLKCKGIESGCCNPLPVLERS